MEDFGISVEELEIIAEQCQKRRKMKRNSKLIKI
jgi:hypothetical protein